MGRLEVMWKHFVSKFTRENDGPEEERKMSLVLAYSVVLMGALLADSIGQHAVFMHDHESLVIIVDDLNKLFLFVFTSTLLVLLYNFGLTTWIKLSLATVQACFLFTLSMSYHAHPWHFGICLVLDFVLMLETPSDGAVLNRFSWLLLLATVVYIAFRSLSMVGSIPTIYPFQDDVTDSDFGQGAALSQWIGESFIIVCNYLFVRMYAVSARMEARNVRDAEEAASLIATKLFHFDLNAAEALLTKAKQDGSATHIHAPLFGLLRNLRGYRSFLPYTLFSREEHSDPPNDVIADAMQGREVSWKHATSAVSRLRDPAYTLGDFHQDVSAAFPELELYDLQELGKVGRRYSSGIEGFVEKQRTMGAMYSVYCFARLDIDGRQVLSFGVDEDWKPKLSPHGPAADKMQNFYKSMDWDCLLELVSRAGLLVVEDTTCPTWPGRRIKLNYDRMMSMLVLTAVHDIMKNQELLPIVRKKHAPYNGMEEGQKLMDHDLALAYVMEHFPTLLPSYAKLEPGQRAPILFTQGKMGFNNGWLVQGEAPPGALFSNFKRVITQGCAGESDVSFYFVHWLTDLAGAEAYDVRPWPGSEKFVLKFPLRVLNTFLESFSYIDHLATKSEVAVMEDYLESRWSALGPPERELRDGYEVAAKRLALMAQGFEGTAVQAFLSLPLEDRETIAAEMARTGCIQQFSGAPTAVRSSPAGPALLVYYAPALVQKAGEQEVSGALSVLAAVYRAARQIFPLDASLESVQKTAVVRIEALKVLDPTRIISVSDWYLQKTSDHDSEVVVAKTLETDLSCAARILMPTHLRVQT